MRDLHDKFLPAAAQRAEVQNLPVQVDQTKQPLTPTWTFVAEQCRNGPSLSDMPGQAHRNRRAVARASQAASPTTPF